MAKINETNYPRRQASEYASTDMLIIQPVAIPEQEHSGDSRTTRVDDLKEYIIGDADPSKIGTPAAGTYTSASNTNAQNIAALDNALANYDHLTKQIATQQEINGYIADPTTASFNVIYLLKDTSATGSDKYYEYMRLGTPQASTFEMTGDTSTDLSNYYTKGEVDTALGDKVSKSATAGLLKNDGSVDTNSYATSAEAYKTGDTAETALADGDYFPFYDTSAAGKRKTLWSNIKSVLKTYFDTLYTAKTTSKGSATKGVYFDSNGAVQEMTYTVSKSVPSDAVFTDTDTKNTAGSTDSSSKLFLIGATSQAANPQTYSQDTAYVGTDGCLYSNSTKVLTAHQTIKQDGVTGATVNRCGTCSTAADTAAKTVSITTGTFSLEAGARISVKFSNANTAGTPTLNVNSKGAKNIFHKGSQITTGNNKALLAGIVDFIYDGTQWHLVGNYIDTNTTYESKAAASGGTAVSLCTTGEKYTWNNKGDKQVSKGSATKGVYFDANGVAQAMTYSVSKNVPSGAVFTDANVTQLEDSSTNADKRILFGSDTDSTVTSSVSKSANLKYNPSTGNLQTTKLNGVDVGSSPKFTDTTYESKAAASGGNDVSLCTTGEKYIWNHHTKTSVQGQGTASASATHTQQIVINDNLAYDIDGTKYMEQTQTVTTSADKTYTFSNAAILATSVIEVFTTDGIPYKSITTASGSVTIVIPKQSVQISVTVRIYIR